MMKEFAAELLATATQRHKDAIRAVEARPITRATVQEALQAFSDVALLAKDARQLYEEAGEWDVADHLAALLEQVAEQQAIAEAGAR
jgi:hypothetical protein